MLTDNERDSIRAAYRRVMAANADFSPRPSQNAMIAAVARAFAATGAVDERICIVEGPTGTGKSQGYLIPGIIQAVAQQRALVISTGTVALQSQLAMRDIPAALKALGVDATVTLLKGRGRYLCPQALETARHDPTQTALGLDVDPGPALSTAVWDTALTLTQRARIPPAILLSPKRTKYRLAGNGEMCRRALPHVSAAQDNPGDGADRKTPSDAARTP